MSHSETTHIECHGQGGTASPIFTLSRPLIGTFAAEFIILPIESSSLEIGNINSLGSYYVFHIQVYKK